MEEVKAKRRGRASRQSDLSSKKKNVQYLGALKNRLPFQTVLNEDELDKIHDASMRILEEIGIAFRDETALAHWREAGARVEDDLVFLDCEMVMDLIGKAPSAFSMTGRNLDRSVEIGGRSTVFCMMQGAPNVRDLDGVRRESRLEDIHNFLKLVQMSPGFQIAPGFVVEANDLPVPHRHLEFVRSNLVHTDMPFFGATTELERAHDTVEMARIVHGDDFLRNNALLICQSSGNSPRLWDEAMLGAGRIYADAGQVVLMSPFVLASANAPCDMAGTLAQVNAEALAGIAYMQLYKPGTKNIYGQFTVSTSLKSGAPMAGVPEISLINYAVGQLARRYGIPWRTTASQASSKVFDAQSGYESAPCMMTGITAGANFMLHAGGWDEAGMVCCYAKYMIDAEQNELYHRMGQGIRMDRLDEAVEAMRNVQPSGHYLGEPFTMKYFKDAFTMPELLDYESQPQWEANGSRDTATRALAKARAMLAEYEAPPMDADVAMALDEFVARRKTEISPSVA